MAAQPRDATTKTPAAIRAFRCRPALRLASLFAPVCLFASVFFDANNPNQIWDPAQPNIWGQSSRAEPLGATSLKVVCPDFTT